MLNKFTVWLCMLIPVQLYRTSMCLRAHEQFSLCGWRCPPTCVNLKLLAAGDPLCPAVWDCRVGCRCSAGYVRDEYSKNCILVQDCPGLTAPTESNLERTRKSPEGENGSMSVAVFPTEPVKSNFLREEDDGLDSSQSTLQLEDHDVGLFRSYDAPYTEVAVSYQPSTPSEPPVSGVVATFSADITPNAIPILLSCAPKVESGHVVPSSHHAYKSAVSDVASIAELLAPDTPAMEFDLNEILDLKSLSSLISPDGNERKRRSNWVKTGASHYIVSEDYPEILKGNHHKVSKDYPQPNMIRVTEYRN